MGIKEAIKTAVARRALSGYEADVIEKMRGGQQSRECPCCGWSGAFKGFGHPPRYDAQCSRCSSLERHRLLALAFQRLSLLTKGDKLLHFAPEPFVTRILSDLGVEYVTADLEPGRADLALNIEATGLPDASFDAVLASHVMEHVNDRAALSELRRILKPGGVLLMMIPIIEGWDESYENASIIAPDEREIHFGQDDHVRFFGRDFRDRVRDAGYDLTEYVADGPESVRYGLLRGERVFIARKV